MEAPALQMCGRCRQSLPLDSFAPSYRGKNGTWCRACFAAWHRGESEPTPHESRPCKWCGREFVPKQSSRARTVFCSRRCKDKEKNARQRAAVEARKPERSCVHCGAAMPRKMRADASFCSAICNSAAHAVTRYMATRLAEPRPDRLVFRALIAERCDWTCLLCGQPVDPAKKHPDPGYGSIDHVIPLAAGGSNDLSNLQLAHLVCNLRKRQFLFPTT